VLPKEILKSISCNKNKIVKFKAYSILPEANDCVLPAKKREKNSEHHSIFLCTLWGKRFMPKGGAMF